jgi:hypothetical protein
MSISPLPIIGEHCSPFLPLNIELYCRVLYNSIMTELKTREHLIYFMVKNLRLSRYDSRFLENLEKMTVTIHRVTSNQVDLLNKLIDKYQRQLIKQGYFIDQLLNLPWTTTIVQTTREYTSAHVGILEDNIILKTPYNKAFITEFRTISQSSFVWDHSNKYYVGDLSTYSLKLAIQTANRFFDDVRYSDRINELLHQMEYYKDTVYWTPTLINANGNYLIACTNSALDKATEHLPLNNELTTLAELVRYGINIDESILLTEEKRFAGSYNPKIELSKICDIVPWLQNIKCDYVSVSGIGLSTNLKFKDDLRQALENAGIQYNDAGRVITHTNLSKYKFPVIVKFKLISDDYVNVAKVINVVNSQPVNLENNETM